MIGLVLENSNPEHYGFIASQKLYDEILAKFKNGFSTKGFQYFWWEIYEKINSTNTFYVFFDKEKEEEKLEQIRCLIRKNLDSEIEEKSKVTLMKFRLQNTFPRMFRIYVKLRNRKL